MKLHTSTVSSAAPVVYTSKQNTWGSWQVKRSQLASSMAANPDFVYSGEQEQEQEEEIGQVYQPQSPYYSLVHPPEFYDDE